MTFNYFFQYNHNCFIKLVWKTSHPKALIPSSPKLSNHVSSQGKKKHPELLNPPALLSYLIHLDLSTKYSKKHILMQIKIITTSINYRVGCNWLKKTDKNTKSTKSIRLINSQILKSKETIKNKALKQWKYTAQRSKIYVEDTMNKKRCKIFWKKMKN